MEQPTYNEPQEAQPVRDRKHRIFDPVVRIVIYVIALFGGFVFTGISAFSISNVLHLNDTATMTLVELILAVIAVIITFWFVTHIDKRPVETLGLTLEKPCMTDFAFGALTAISAMGVLFLITCAFGWVKITGFVLNAGIIIESLILMAAIAVFEEVVSRGYILQTLRSGYGTAAAVIINSAIFASLHFSNAGGRSLAALSGIFAAGIVLSYAYITTKRLWLPIGIHFGWNLALGPIFGFRVSGNDLPSLIQLHSNGPTWWLGGKFGPESGLWVIAALILIAIALHRYNASSAVQDSSR